MLAHDLANKLAAVVSHCDLVELECEPGSPTHQHAEKIRQLAFQMTEMLHTRECECKPSVDVQDRESSVLA
jgi:hypothetical protein